MIATRPEVLKLSGVLLISIVMFGVSVAATIIASLSKRIGVWKAAQMFYLIGWISLAILMFALLLNVGYHIDIFSIPNIQLSSNSLGALFTFAAAVITAVLMRSVSYRLDWEMRALLERTPDLTLRKGPKRTDIEVRVSFLQKIIEIERALREYAKVEKAISARKLASQLLRTGMISPSLVQTIESVWKVRNAVVHGVDVPDKDIAFADEFAEYVLLQLSKLRG